MSDFVARLAVKGMMTCAGCRDAENKQPHTCGIDFALHEQERTSVGAAALATDKRKRHEVQLRSDTCGVAVKFDTADGAAPPPPPGAPALPKVWLRTLQRSWLLWAAHLMRARLEREQRDAVRQRCRLSACCLLPAAACLLPAICYLSL